MINENDIVKIDTTGKEYNWIRVVEKQSEDTLTHVTNLIAKVRKALTKRDYFCHEDDMKAIQFIENIVEKELHNQNLGGGERKTT